MEFLFSTADEPAALLHYFANGTDPDRLPPVLSFCKSSRSHADVLVPDIHFFMRNFTSGLLAAAANFTATWPWELKKPALFGRSVHPRRGRGLGAGGWGGAGPSAGRYDL